MLTRLSSTDMRRGNGRLSNLQIKPTRRFATIPQPHFPPENPEHFNAVRLMCKISCYLRETGRDLASHEAHRDFRIEVLRPRVQNGETYTSILQEVNAHGMENSNLGRSVRDLYADWVRTGDHLIPGPVEQGPLGQFSIHPILDLHIGNFYFSFTNLSLSMLLTLGLVLVLVFVVTKKGGGKSVCSNYLYCFVYIYLPKLMQYLVLGLCLYSCAVKFIILILHLGSPLYAAEALVFASSYSGDSAPATSTEKNHMDDLSRAVVPFLPRGGEVAPNNPGPAGPAAPVPPEAPIHQDIEPLIQSAKREKIYFSLTTLYGSTHPEEASQLTEIILKKKENILGELINLNSPVNGQILWQDSGDIIRNPQSGQEYHPNTLNKILHSLRRDGRHSDYYKRFLNERMHTIPNDELIHLEIADIPIEKLDQLNKAKLLLPYGH